MPAKHVTVIGAVQGVFFRATTKEMADELGINGWVRNTNDGEVEIHAEGDDVAINKLIEWCHTGPSAADVSNVEVEDGIEEGFGSFEIQHE